MMCSIEELGSTRDYYPEAPEDGIYIFKDDVTVGDDAIEVLGLHDTVFEYEITSNRVDCYSVLGIAREAAVTFNKKFNMPDNTVKGNTEDVNDYVSVEVIDTDLCSRYCARVVKNIKLGPSPEWMQRRLAASGIRPINNIVDITNYVMEEYGQPMHAFDLDQVEGHKIVVKRAKDGEKFMTLDGQERTLDSEMLMINDAGKAIGIAGIMGGENSKITDDVKTMLFEAATFNGANIRKSAKRLGLRTDASGKFEKGLDPRNAIEAINRACALIEELGCGEVVGGVVDVCAPLKDLNKIEFRPTRINDLLGTDIDADTMLDIFKRLELEYDASTNMITIPSFRQDLEGIADLAEEVCRFYGYDKVPSTLPSGEATTGKISFKSRIEQKAREVAEYCGFSQGMCYSFESPKVFDKLLIDKDDVLRQAITISNPLGEDFSIMRTISLNGMLTSLATNYNRRNKDARLYEMANIYLPKSLPLTENPDERMQFTLGFYGNGDFFTMKGVIEEFFDSIGMKGKLNYDPKSGKPFLHPGRQADIVYDGKIVGYIGEVHPTVSENYGINDRVIYADIDMPYIVELASFTIKYEGIAKFPASTRDISLVVDKSVLVGTMTAAIEKKGGKLLEECRLFDIYEGEQVGEGKKSVAFALTFRAKDRTLADTEINEIMEKILAELTKLGANLRQ